MKKTKLEIINETVAYYSEDVSRRAIRRSENSYNCEYITNDGRNCAVGRLLLNPERYVGENNYMASTLLTKEGLTILKPEYRIKNYIFWNALQDLHDSINYWDEEGLTQDGKRYVEKLKEKYK